MSSFVHAHCGCLFFLAALSVWAAALWPWLARGLRFFFSRKRRQSSNKPLLPADVTGLSLCIDEDGTVLGAVPAPRTMEAGA